MGVCRTVVRISAFLLGATISAVAPAPSEARLASDDVWLVAGGDLADTHGTPLERRIHPGNAGSLAPKWIFTTTNDVSATPTVERDALYVPDWGGMLYRLDARTGTAVWSRKLSDFTGNQNSLTRSSPAITDHTIIVGDEASGTVMAVDKATGQ